MINQDSITKYIKGILYGFLSIQVGWAQMLKYPPPRARATQVWHNDILYTLSADSKTIIKEQKGKPAITISAPKTTAVITTWNGECWAYNSSIELAAPLATDESKEAGRPSEPLIDLTLYKYDEFFKWSLAGRVDYKNGFPRSLYPLGKDGLFLADNLDGSFVEKAKGSFFALFQRDREGRVDFQQLVDLEVGGESIFELTKIDHGIPLPNAFPTIKKKFNSILPFSRSPIRAGKYIIIVSIRSGLLWILDGETGKVKTVINPMHCEEKDLSQNSKIDSAIIAIQPDKRGRLLIAAKNEYFFKNASNFYDFLKKDANKEETQKEEDARFAALANARKDFFEIQWIAVDPETGDFWTETPLDLPTKLLDPNLFLKFKFKFNLEGKPIPE